jgi:hypothetical protein
MPQDIETIIAEVRRLIPEVEVIQMHKTHEVDDDGLWWFRLPGVTKDIQIESSSYNCPFLIEQDSIGGSINTIVCSTVEQVVSTITHYLEPLRNDRV